MSTRFIKVEYLSFSELIEELNRLGPKIDSGRHTGADVERLKQCIARYIKLEEEKNNGKQSKTKCNEGH